MLGHTSLPDGKTALPLQVEREQAALSQNVASLRRARFLWTGLGSTVIMVIGISTCAHHPLASQASAEPARLVPQVASFDLLTEKISVGSRESRRRRSGPDALQPTDWGSTVIRPADVPGSIPVSFPIVEQASDGQPAGSEGNFDNIVWLRNMGPISQNRPPLRSRKKPMSFILPPVTWSRGVRPPVMSAAGHSSGLAAMHHQSREWAVTTEEIARYSDIFKTEADASGSGFAGLQEAKVVLERSGLPVSDLIQIWQISDIDRDGYLSQVEFVCAMALVAQRLQGAPLPGTIPAELLAGVTGVVGSSPENPAAGLVFTKAQIDSLQRDNYVVIDEGLSNSDKGLAYDSAKALVDRGDMVNLNQEGRDDDVAVFATNAMPQRGVSFGLTRCSDVLLSIPGALRKACGEFDVNDASFVAKCNKTKAPSRIMCAHYAAGGARYVAHLDNDPQDQGNDAGDVGLRPSDRTFTCIVYLNPHWKSTDGGCFRAYLNGTVNGEFVDVEPKLGRIVIFDSSRLLHEVRPSYAESRLAISAWI